MSLRDSDRAWEKWGKIDPYFGVLSADVYRTEGLTDSARKDFFSSGDAHIDEVFSVLRTHLDPQFQPRISIDFGCGTGRLAIPLSRRSARVVGVDVSEAMLREAGKNCAARDIANVTFVQSVDALPAWARQADFIHSFIVFQHIPVPRGMRILEQLISHLVPGGCLALHFTIYREISLPRKVVTWARHNIPFAHEFLQIVARKPVREPPMQMNTYDLSRILFLLEKSEAEMLVVKLTNHGGHLGAMVFAKKRAAAHEGPV